MTPQQAIDQLDQLVAQVKNPALNRAEQVHMQNCIATLRQAIEKPEPPREETEQPVPDQPTTPSIDN